MIAPATDNALATLSWGKGGRPKHGKVVAYTLSGTATTVRASSDPTSGGPRSTSERHAAIKMEKDKRDPRYKP